MRGTVLIDRSARLRMTFRGEKARDVLGGVLTNDVLALSPGLGQRAAALTPKGRIIALCRIFDRGRDLLVDADIAAAEGFVSMIRKYVNPRLATFAVETEAIGCLGLIGDESTALTERMGASESSLAGLPPLGGHWLGAAEQGLFAVRSTDFGPNGIDLFGPPEQLGALSARLLAAGLRTASTDDVRIARVEAGLPEWGVDVDADTLPQEALLDELGFLSFTKGCYTGQEVVARIHFRGHVNRLLRWLSATKSLRSGSKVTDAAGNEIGDVRSSVDSPSRGPLAIAMVRREVEPGSDVWVHADGHVTVARLERLSPRTGEQTAPSDDDR